MTYQQFLNNQKKRAKASGCEVEAIKLLILELSGYDGASFVAHLSDELPIEQEQLMKEAVDKYIVNGIPVQHILGYTYFFGYRINVSGDVLIPRSETEELVGYVLEKYDEVFQGRPVTVVDVGTGSGALAIALTKEEPSMTMYATDISPKALEVAKENALLNQANITFIEGDMLKPLIEKNLKFDILVSNPPYIPNHEEVQKIVIDNEPHVALFGGEDGMDFYRIILANASLILNPQSIIAFEHSYNKGQEMVNLAKTYFPNSKVYSIKDLNGCDRMTIIVNGD